MKTDRIDGAPPRPATHLSATELAELRARLELERQRLATLYLEDVRHERAVEFTEAEDEVDRTGKSIERAEESALADREREQLRLVEEALERMNDGTYGRCLRSGAPIPLARLEAVPWTRYVRDVQEDVESGALLESAPPGEREA